ncbi:MAG: hypothetical protein AAGC96_06460 [Pseudomonadota bacterium]
MPVLVSDQVKAVPHEPFARSFGNVQMPVFQTIPPEIANELRVDINKNRLHLWPNDEMLLFAFAL